MKRVTKVLVLLTVLAMLVSACSTAPSTTSAGSATEAATTEAATTEATTTEAAAAEEAAGEVTATEASAPGSPFQSVIAITEVFTDGQRVTAVAAEYPSAIDNDALSPAAFSVSGRTITNVYANSEPAKAAQGVNGNYVIIELSPDDANASTFSQETGGGMGAGPQASEQLTATEGMTAADQVTGTGGVQGGPPMTGMGRTLEAAQVTVAQVGDVATADGQTIPANATTVENDQVINLVVDDFQQLEYADPATAITVTYNLYVPEGYDASQQYPLVMFIPDAGGLTGDPLVALAQGLGGVIWATPEEQAKHPSFVLVPTYSGTVVNDNWEAAPDLDATVNLIKYLQTQYSIDPNRIYTTGQSAGCMSSIVMMINYPDLFAGALLVAGQWDPAAMATLTGQNMWIIVSEGDEKAFPGMNAGTEALEAAGATISRATWNGRAAPEEFAADVSAVLAEGNHIMYTVLQQGTVVPEGLSDDGGNNHTYTWRIAYTIEGLRDWLFAQVKTAS